MVDNGYLSTIGNDGSEYSVGKITILCKIGDAAVTESHRVLMLDSASYGDKHVTWSDFVVSVYSDRSIEYERISSEVGTAKGLVGV